MSVRDEAFKHGHTTYNTGKPCKRGHYSPRYSSNGVCIQCLKYHHDERLNRISRGNMIRSGDMTQHTVGIRSKYINVLNDLTDIMIEDGYRAELLAQYIMLIGDSSLNADDLKRLLVKDSEGFMHHAIRSGANGHAEVEIMGEWYVLAEVREVEQGKRDRVVRVRPPVVQPS